MADSGSEDIAVIGNTDMTPSESENNLKNTVKPIAECFCCGVADNVLFCRCRVRERVISVLLWLMNGHVNFAKISAGSAKTLHELHTCCCFYYSVYELKE